MTAFIYPLEGSWTWGGNDVFGLYNLGDLGFLDFAGSGIVHMAGAAAGVAGVLTIGARKGKYSADGKVNAIPGANMPLATLGTFILWMGWFGFNGGSVLATATVGDANAVAVVFLNTNAAAAGGCIIALLVAKFAFGKADLTMALNGCLAGLVAITAGPDTPSPLGATIIGGLGGALVVASIVTLDKLKFDDPVGAISVHGVVGLLGLLAVPFTNSDASYLRSVDWRSNHFWLGFLSLRLSLSRLLGWSCQSEYLRKRNTKDPILLSVVLRPTQSLLPPARCLSETLGELCSPFFYLKKLGQRDFRIQNLPCKRRAIRYRVANNAF